MATGASGAVMATTCRASCSTQGHGPNRSCTCRAGESGVHRLPTPPSGPPRKRRSCRPTASTSLTQTPSAEGRRVFSSSPPPNPRHRACQGRRGSRSGTRGGGFPASRRGGGGGVRSDWAGGIHREPSAQRASEWCRWGERYSSGTAAQRGVSSSRFQGGGPRRPPHSRAPPQSFRRSHDRCGGAGG